MARTHTQRTTPRTAARRHDAGRPQFMGLTFGETAKTETARRADGQTDIRHSLYAAQHTRMQQAGTWRQRGQAGVEHGALLVRGHLAKMTATPPHDSDFPFRAAATQIALLRTRHKRQEGEPCRGAPRSSAVAASARCAAAEATTTAGSKTAAVSRAKRPKTPCAAWAGTAWPINSKRAARVLQGRGALAMAPGRAGMGGGQGAKADREHGRGTRCCELSPLILSAGRRGAARGCAVGGTQSTRRSRTLLSTRGLCRRGTFCTASPSWWHPLRFRVLDAALWPGGRHRHAEPPLTPR